MSERIHLSLAHLGGHEKNYVSKAFEDNWVTTAGPNLEQFEKDLCQYTGAQHAVAVSSGTAAIHLALLALGTGPGDEVLCSTFTFIASANPILYTGATPVFVESEASTWNMSPEWLEKAILERKKQGKKPKAIILVHLYGMPALLEELLAVADKYGIPVVEDAAESLGSRYRKQQTGTFGKIGIYSFNGNKIITTSGGGAIITNDPEIAAQVRFLANQAKDPAPYYQHSQMGFNYRLSNICAGIGRGQMEVLEKRVKQRREIFAFYEEQLRPLPGISFLREPPGTISNRWLTCLLIDKASGTTADALRLHLESANIEARLLWKPLHLQPLFAETPYYGDRLSEKLFATGLCLPSGSSLTEEELHRVVKAIRKLVS